VSPLQLRFSAEWGLHRFRLERICSWASLPQFFFGAAVWGRSVSASRHKSKSKLPPVRETESQPFASSISDGPVNRMWRQLPQSRLAETVGAFLRLERTLVFDASRGGLETTGALGAVPQATLRHAAPGDGLALYFRWRSPGDRRWSGFHCKNAVWRRWLGLSHACGIRLGFWEWWPSRSAAMCFGPAGPGDPPWEMAMFRQTDFHRLLRSTSL